MSKKKLWFKKGKRIYVNNRMQKRYSYTLTYNAGTNIKKGGIDTTGKLIKYPNFNPKFTPGQMLRMGVFEGKYCNDQIFEFPREWFDLSKLSPGGPDVNVNYFKEEY